MCVCARACVLDKDGQSLEILSWLWAWLVMWERILEWRKGDYNYKWPTLKPAVLAHTCNPGTGEVKQENQDFKIIFCSMWSSRLSLKKRQKKNWKKKREKLQGEKKSKQSGLSFSFLTLPFSGPPFPPVATTRQDHTILPLLGWPTPFCKAPPFWLNNDSLLNKSNLVPRIEVSWCLDSCPPSSY